MSKTKPLALLPSFENGNTKAAASQAGATSADLWMTPYDQIRYDPADNVRPVDEAWVKELTALMIQHGYDKGSPLHCYVRKEGDRDLFYVYKGQHRYLAAGAAIKAGKNLGKIPLVVRAANEVDRAKMVIDGHHSNRQKAASPLDLAAAIAELRDVHQYDAKQISAELGITDQTIRDIALLEQAPAALHDLVRSGAVAGTLAIEQIRAHGADKALDRISAGLSAAKETGKSKVTKKHLEARPPEKLAPAAAKIDSARAKQLLQALQSVLHDPAFGQLSPGTINAVHCSLQGLEDLLDLPQKSQTWPIASAGENGCYSTTDSIDCPGITRDKHGQRTPIATIRVAQVEDGVWIFASAYNIGTSFASSPLKRGPKTTTSDTRVLAIQAGARALLPLIESERDYNKKSPAIREIRNWITGLLRMPDPDWTPELAAKHTVSQGAF